LTFPILALHFPGVNPLFERKWKKKRGRDPRRAEDVLGFQISVYRSV
jgi:hypothetical protein